MDQAALKVPMMDIVDRDDDVMVRVDLPGVKKEDVDVSLTDNTITVKGTTSEEKKEEEGDYYRCETMKGSFAPCRCPAMSMAARPILPSRMAFWKWLYRNLKRHAATQSKYPEHDIYLSGADDWLSLTV